jgi:hypothetical protein
MPVASPTRYQPSGKLGRALSITPLAVLIGVPILSLVYAYIDVYCPVVGYVTMLFLAGFVFGLALIVALAGYRAKCRNPNFLRFMGLVAGVWGLYFAWAAFEYALLRRSDAEIDVGLFSFLTHPGVVWNIAAAINEEGWYSMRNTTPSGAFLWSLWGIEAVAAIGVPVIAAPLLFQEEVFCEPCDRWCNSTKGHVHLAPTQDPGVLDSIRRGAVQALESLDRVPKETAAHICVDTWQCPRCQSTSAFRARLVTKVTDKKGKTEEKKVDLSDLMLLDSTSFSRLQDLSRKPVIGEPPPAEASPSAESKD